MIPWRSSLGEAFILTKRNLPARKCLTFAFKSRSWVCSPNWLVYRSPETLPEHGFPSANSRTKCVKSVQISIQPLADHDERRGCRGNQWMSEWLPRRRIRDVDLCDRLLGILERIAERDAVVRQAARIDDDCVR